jgi:hypothetical protein
MGKPAVNTGFNTNSHVQAGKRITLVPPTGRAIGVPCHASMAADIGQLRLQSGEWMSTSHDA